MTDTEYVEQARQTPMGHPNAAPEWRGHGWITGTADIDALNGQAWREEIQPTEKETI